MITEYLRAIPVSLLKKKLRMKSIKILMLFMVAALAMQSCRKDSDIIDVSPPAYLPVENVNASVMGVVVKENGAPISYASVTHLNKTIKTDVNGVFRFNNRTMNSRGTFITAEKDGYIVGSRKFYPQQGTISRVKIELIDPVNVAVINSSEDQVVTFQDVELRFPKDCFASANESIFDGNVRVFASYLDPTSLSTLDRMPGDLTGVDVLENQVVLSTFGMITVELRKGYSLESEEVIIRDGYKVDISIPIPEALVGNAPSQIPLWHFDESLGIWKEEGTANLVNGKYEGKVSHFSFWNCDDPYDLIQLSGTLLSNGAPLHNTRVNMTVIEDGSVGSGYTDEKGNFTGKVPKGLELTFELYNLCGEIIHVGNIGPFDEDTVLDPMELFLSISNSNLAGHINACGIELSNSTYVMVSHGSYNYFFDVTEDLVFDAELRFCSDDVEFEVTAVDPENERASQSKRFEPKELIDVGELALCEDFIVEHLNYIYGGNNFLYEVDPTYIDSSTAFSYWKQDFTDSTDYYVIFRTQTLPTSEPIRYEFDFTYIEGEPLQHIEMPVPEAGFNASGIATVDKLEQGGETYIQAYGVLDVIEVTDPLIYNSSHTSLDFSFLFKLRE